MAQGYPLSGNVNLILAKHPLTNQMKFVTFSTAQRPVNEIRELHFPARRCRCLVLSITIPLAVYIAKLIAVQDL
jgi:hypothetical protein